MTPQQIKLVQESFAKVQPVRDTVSSLFYARLFELDPSLRPLFCDDMAKQGMKLMTAFSTIVAGLYRPENVQPFLKSMGVRHCSYGVREEHFQTVGAALLWSLEQGLADDFTDEVRTAWGEAYKLISSVMLEAAREAA